MPATPNGQKRSTRHSALPIRDHGHWRIRWIDSAGRRRSKSFGANAYQEAVAELERIKGEVRAVKDGRAPAPVQPTTFGAFVDRYWIPNRTAAKRSPKDDHSILRAHLRPALADLPLPQITTERVERLRGDLATAGLKPKTVANILTLLLSILRHAQELDLLFRLPRIKKPRVSVPDYDYLKSEGDIRAFLSAAREEGADVFALYATAIYTGMRLGELFGLRWDDVNRDRGFIMVRRSFDRPTKSGKPRYVPIMDALAPILREWRLKRRGSLVFPSRAGAMQTPAARVSQETLHRVLARAKLPRLRFHDLRHTFASHFVMRGGDLFVLQKLLGHSSQAMTQRYAHLAPEAFDAVRGLFGDKPPATGPAEVRRLKPAPARNGRRARR